MGKSVPLTGPDTPDPGEEFTRFFPSHNQEKFVQTKHETEVLKLFRCLPAEYVSTELLESLLGPHFPLGDTLASLTAQGVLVRNQKNGGFLLSRREGEDCAPDAKAGAVLMNLIGENLSRAGDRNDGAARLNWLGLGRSVLEKFEGCQAPEFAEFRRTLIKNYCDAGRWGDAKKLMEKIPSDSPRLPAEDRGERGRPYPSGESLRSLLPYISFCDAIVTNRSSAAVGIHYDDDNMFAPIIMVLEEGFLAEAVIRAAEETGIPVIENVMLAGNLLSYGKLGQPIPDICYRAVSALFSRIGTRRIARRRQVFRKNGREITVKLRRPLLVELGVTAWFIIYENPEQEKLLAEPLRHIVGRLRRLVGFPLPSIRVLQNDRLRDNEYRVLFKGIEAGRGHLDFSWCSGAEKDPPSPSGNPFIDDFVRLRSAAAAGSGVVIRHVEEIAMRRAPDLLGRDEIQALLDGAEKKFPVVTGEVKNVFSLGTIRDILQSLVSEQVSIRHIEVILETLADWGGFGPAPNDVIIEQIRQSLKRQICQEYIGDGFSLKVLTLESKLDQCLADRLMAQSSDTIREQAILPEDFMEFFSLPIHNMEEKGLRPVILCSPATRSWVKEITRKKFPDLAVLSYIEIPPDISVEQVGEIRLEGRRPGY